MFFGSVAKSFRIIGLLKKKKATSRRKAIRLKRAGIKNPKSYRDAIDMMVKNEMLGRGLFGRYYLKED